MLGVAHRAGNDLDALRAAARERADVVEVDVHLRRGRLEVRHHKSLGPLPWVWEKWELRRSADVTLDLEDVLAAVPPTTIVMLDLKGVGRVGRAVAERLRQLPPAQPVWVCARWWPSVAPFRGTRLAQVLLSVRGRTELARLCRLLARTDDPPLGVCVHLSLLTPGVVGALHERVQHVLTWPVDDEVALARAERMGVDGVITLDEGVLARVTSGPR